MAVEFALVLFPLLMILGGLVNFGFAFAQQLSLDNAVRQAARAGVVDRSADMTAIATTEFANSALGASDVPAIAFPQGATCTGSTFGRSMEVHGDVTVTFLFPWVLPESVLPDTIDLHSEAEFRCEYS
ncbi:TadE/TadG family type IV pilus assembly protein [Nocardioides sp. Soil777]|uniref:TadE/TadG family type IV pilus assembly protein n=1 Tax=Nocardioides sp. Soil777 TaxID=1736409 RepID=UPI000A914A9D|nr:TadE family protein [Nocardioides sp. Soil777]